MQIQISPSMQIQISPMQIHIVIPFFSLSNFYSNNAWDEFVHPFHIVTLTKIVVIFGSDADPSNDKGYIYTIDADPDLGIIMRIRPDRQYHRSKLVNGFCCLEPIEDPDRVITFRAKRSIR